MLGSESCRFSPVIRDEDFYSLCSVCEEHNNCKIVDIFESDFAAGRDMGMRQKGSNKILIISSHARIEYIIYGTTT